MESINSHNDNTIAHTKLSLSLCMSFTHSLTPWLIRICLRACMLKYILRNEHGKDDLLCYLCGFECHTKRRCAAKAGQITFKRLNNLRIGFDLCVQNQAKLSKIIFRTTISVIHGRKRLAREQEIWSKAIWEELRSEWNGYGNRINEQHWRINTLNIINH